MNTEKIIKNLSKMNAYELRMICREMKCKVGSKTQMIAHLLAPLLKGKYKFRIKNILDNLPRDMLFLIADSLDFKSLKNLISSETDEYVKNLLIQNIKFNNETIKLAVSEYLESQIKAVQIYGNIGNWNVSNVSIMSNLFENATLFNEDISNWDTSNVTDMNEMFAGATSFNQPIGNWDTSNVTDMSFMFYNAKSFNQPIGKWDTSNVINMSNMFDGSASFNQNINDWKIDNVWGSSNMFKNAASFDRENSTWCGDSCF